MKLVSTWFVLLTIGTADALRPAQTATTTKLDQSYAVILLANRNGWVNPEDLASMPQCIAQQDPSAWLNAMTRCTHKQCTRHFGVICTHHQWLTQLSCLSTEFSADLVSQYLPYCSRSVLAKTQLFHWIRTITGRTWLVKIGDANGLDIPSPMSLAEGHMTVGVTDKAPMCLVRSAFGSTMEPFQHVMASCSFTSDTRHTGFAARPWEYSESQGTMVSLDVETAGYDLTLRRVAYGDYFDKWCFCEIASIETKTEPCPGPSLESTRERLWMNATCGPKSLPTEWTKGLHTTAFAYIPTEKWRWPACVADMPERVTGLLDQCTTDACEVDSDGYCNIKRAVDRACFCRSFTYDSCNGPCHIFEARIDFVKWTHDLCGKVDGWHGLPKHWRQLAGPSRTDMIPWRWNVMPLGNSDQRHRGSKSSSNCASAKWKLGYFFAVNSATLITALYVRTSKHHYAYPQSWLVSGLAIAALQLCGNWVNVVLVQATAGYETFPVLQLALLWCSIPRLTWSPIWLAAVRPFTRSTLHSVASFLLAETILQAFAATPMIRTITYGLQHDFYSEGMAKLKEIPAAQSMYLGAALWIIVILVASILLLQAAHRFIALPESQTEQQSASTIVKDLMTPLRDEWIGFEERLARYWLDGSCDPEERPLMHGHDLPHVAYGTLPTKDFDYRITETERTVVRLTLIAITSIPLLWVAQWMFWAGFVNLNLEGYCPPDLGLLTAVWTVSSVVVVVFL